MDFGWPNVEIGWKMANGQLLFLALAGLCEVAIHPIEFTTLWIKLYLWNRTDHPCME